MKKIRDHHAGEESPSKATDGDTEEAAAEEPAKLKKAKSKRKHKSEKDLVAPLDTSAQAESPMQSIAESVEPASPQSPTTTQQQPSAAPAAAQVATLQLPKVAEPSSSLNTPISPTPDTASGTKILTRYPLDDTNTDEFGFDKASSPPESHSMSST